MNEAVIDASIVIAFTLPDEADNAKAVALIAALAKQGTRLYAPMLWEAEIDSVIRRLEYTGKLTPEMGNMAFAIIDALSVEMVYLPTIRPHARMLARKLNQVRVYDCTYAALAQIRGCDFWTADKRFYAGAKGSFSWVRYVGEKF